MFLRLPHEGEDMTFPEGYYSTAQDVEDFDRYADGEAEP